MKNQYSLLHSLKWSTFGHILPQSVSPFITVFIARLLNPEAFGLVAVAMIIISFLQMIISTGFTNALIQKQGTKKKIYKTADFIFCFNLSLSIAFYALILWTSQWIAIFFNNSGAESVISILSLCLIINTLGNVQLALLQKDMEFKSIFLRQIVPVSVQLIVTLPLAYNGFGVWALIFGKLTSDTLATIILWWKSKWKPRFNFNFKDNSDIIKFGLYVMASSLMAWVLTQGDNLIVGKFVSVEDLGLYKVGYDLNQKILGLLIIPIIPVFYSKFCSFKTEESLKQYYLTVKEYLSIIVFPFMGGIIIISPYFEKLILGDKWEGIAFVMALLTITGISNLWALADSMYKSLGRPEISAKNSLIHVCFYVPLWLFFIQFGLKTFLIARVFIAIMSISLNTYFENHVLKINIYRSFKFYYKAIAATAGMIFVGFSYQHFILKNNYNCFALISLISLSIITYAFMISIFANKQINLLRQFFLKNL